MKLSPDSTRQAFQLAVSGVTFCAMIPGHKPWEHGWGVVIGGVLACFVAIMLVSGVVFGGYLKIRERMIHKALLGHPSRPELQPDETSIVVSLTVAVIAVFVLLADVGAFAGLSEVANHDGPSLR